MGKLLERIGLAAIVCGLLWVVWVVGSLTGFTRQLKSSVAPVSRIEATVDRISERIDKEIVPALSRVQGGKVQPVLQADLAAALDGALASRFPRGRVDPATMALTAKVESLQTVVASMSKALAEVARAQATLAASVERSLRRVGEAPAKKVKDAPEDKHTPTEELMRGDNR